MRPRPFLFGLAAAACAWAAAAPAQRLDYADVLGEPAAAAAEAQAPSDGRVRDVYLDRTELRGGGGGAYHWDWAAEIGGPRHRLWLSTTGDGSLSGGIDYAEVQALYSRPILDGGLALQAGVRQDFVPRPRRSYAAIGLQGNVAEPLFVGAFAFLSHRGELTARLFALHDLPIVADRLILQAAAEAEVAAADVPALGIGAGPVYVEGGLRLRWQLREAFAPYVGVNWERLTGRTARLARDAGEEVEATSLLLGVRSYF